MRGKIYIPVLIVTSSFFSLALFFVLSLYFSAFTPLFSIILRMLAGYIVLNLLDYQIFRKTISFAFVLFFIALFVCFLLTTISYNSGIYTLSKLFPFGQSNGYPVAQTMFGFLSSSSIPFRPSIFFYEPIQFGLVSYLFLLCFINGSFNMPKYVLYIFSVFAIIMILSSLSIASIVSLLYLALFILIYYFLNRILRLAGTPIFVSFCLLIAGFFIPFHDFNSGQERIDRLNSTLAFINSLDFLLLLHPVTDKEYLPLSDTFISLFLSIGLPSALLIYFILIFYSIKHDRVRDIFLYILPFSFSINLFSISFFLLFYLPFSLSSSRRGAHCALLPPLV